MVADGSGKQKLSSCGDGGERLIHVDSPGRKIGLLVLRKRNRA